MSRHMWRAADGRDVWMGWDEPMRTFFLDVYEDPATLGPDDEDGAYHSMDDTSVGWPNVNVDDFLNRAKELGYTPPDGIREALLADRAGRVMNVDRRWPAEADDASDR